MLHTNNIAKQLSTELYRKSVMPFNSMIAAEISGMSRKVNTFHTVADKLPCGIMYKSSGAHQIEYLAL